MPDDRDKPKTPRRKPTPPAEAPDAGLDDDMEDFTAARPVAVGSGTSLSARLADLSETEGDIAEGEAHTPTMEEIYDLSAQPADAAAGEDGSRDGTQVIESPRAELIAIGISLALAVSVFVLPWYTIGSATLSGWKTGTWGPVVFFLALASATILGLRRVGVKIAFPVDHSLVIEGIGWICTVGILLKNLMRPAINSFPSNRHLLSLVSLLLAVGLALIGPKLSGSAPFVIRPGWFASNAGRLGAAVLIVAIGAGAAFGLTVDPNAKGTSLAGKNPAIKTIKGFPPCMKEAGFPLIKGVKAGDSVDAREAKVCYASFSTKLTAATVFSQYKAALILAGWKVTIPKTIKTPGAVSFRTLELRSPRCGRLQVITAAKGKGVSSMIATLQPCATPQPSK